MNRMKFHSWKQGSGAALEGRGKKQQNKTNQKKLNKRKQTKTSKKKNNKNKKNKNKNKKNNNKQLTTISSSYTLKLKWFAFGQRPVFIYHRQMYDECTRIYIHMVKLSSHFSTLPNLILPNNINLISCICHYHVLYFHPQTPPTATPLPFQIFNLLGIPMKSYSGKPLFKMEDLLEKRYEAIRYIFQLCYTVIQHAQYMYRKNQVLWCM